MNLLLDTHAFIWWDSEPGKLSAQVLALCQDSRNTLLLSVASVWEMQIKLQLGKLKLTLPLAEIVESQRRDLCRKAGPLESQDTALHRSTTPLLHLNPTKYFAS